MAGTRKPRIGVPDLALLQREVNQLFARLAELERPEPTRPGEWAPSVDVFECHGALMVVVEVPGLAPESLKVSLEEGSLVVSGERRERRPAGAETFLCLERPQGRFSRTIPLDVPVDVRQAEARLSKGLLAVSLPRVKDRRGRETTIPVKREQEE